MLYEWADEISELYVEVLDEAYMQGYTSADSYKVMDKIYAYVDDRMIRDALDWNMCVDMLLEWLVLKTLFDYNNSVVADHMSLHGLEFTPTGFGKLISDVELYEKIVAPVINKTVLNKIAEELNVELTEDGIKKTKPYTIPVQWIMTGKVEVDAVDLDEAIEMVNNDRDRNGKAFALPTDSYYLEDSFEVSDTREEIERYFL